MSNSRILVIYTGGTIGMVKTANGYAPESDEFNKLLRGIPELNKAGMPEWDITEMTPLLDSSNVTAAEWNSIGEIIKNNYHNYDGFVVLHGTDTMAYTASALSFTLEGLVKPVVLTGAQIPLCETGSDARNNIINAVKIAADNIVREVSICFGSRLIRGNRATKASTDDFDAFVSPNCDYLAEIRDEIIYNKDLYSDADNDNEEFVLCELKTMELGIIKVFPGIQCDMFTSLMTDKLKGLIIETFGTGDVPTHENAILPAIKKAVDNGTAVVACTQCITGTVRLGAYEVSSELKNSGVISGYDMTTEAAFAKLYYLLSKGYSSEKIETEMEKNLRGELSLR